MFEMRSAYAAITSAQPLSATVGKLVVTTGKLVACDPVLNPDRPAFDRTVPVGQFPVRVLFNEQGLLVAAAVTFADGAPHSWEMALLSGQNLATLQPNGFFGYPVDDEYGCFMDEAAFAQMERREELEIGQVGEEEYLSYFDDVIEPEMAGQNDFRMLNHRPMADHDLNVMVFQSGAGNGVYASYWGLDAQGRVVTILTDFGIDPDEFAPRNVTSPETGLLAAVLDDEEEDDDDLEDDDDDLDEDELDEDDADLEPDEDEAEPEEEPKRAFDDEDVYGGDDLDRF